LFDSTDALHRNQSLACYLGECLQTHFADHPHVSDIRQCGMIAAVEFVANKQNRQTFPWRERRHLRLYRHAIEQGVLLRPLGNVIYFMPPYVINENDIDLMTEVAVAGLNVAVSQAGS
jgi:adenosylmethionine-8-amino-7-oxononanoate aminotransferase